MAGSIIVQRAGTVATVVLNRPEKLNACTIPMYLRLGEAIAGLSADDSIRCVVLEGAGERAFCSGSDIGSFEDDRLGAAQARSYAEDSNRALRHLRDCRHPTIAKIRGVCVGGGLEIAAMCDIRICSSDSRFGIPPNRLGLTLDYEELEALCDLVGRRTALEMLIEGRIFGADEAHHMRLVTRVVAAEQLDDEVAAASSRIATAAPLSNRWHKAFVRRMADPRPLSDAERDEAFLCYDTYDYREGTAAFNEKRPPRFEGR